MRTGRHVARGRRRFVLTFGAALVMALGLAPSGLVASAAMAASGPVSGDDPAAGSGCTTPSHPVLCGGDAASSPVAGSSDSAGTPNDRAASTTARGARGTGDADQEETTPADLEVTKVSDASGVLDEGDPITYTITVTNVGETVAEDVVVQDELPPGMAPVALGPSLKGELCIPTSSVVVGGVPHAALRCGPVSLDPGESAPVEFEASTRWLCGTIVNEVDVEASNEPAELVGADNHARVTDEVEACHPSLSLDVTASPTEGAVGTSIVYTYTVTNTGDTTLYSMTVRDDELGTLGIVDGFSLRPGGTERFTATATLGTSPITNVATAVGEDVTGQRVTAQDSVTVAVVSAGGGGDGDDDGPGGTPFTGADTGGLGVLVLVLSTLGATLVALTRRRGGAAE